MTCGGGCSTAFREHYMADLKRIPPRYVNNGPIFENIIIGDQVDVTIFPTPKWHDADGGRYIGTGSFNVTRDPDEGWISPEPGPSPSGHMSRYLIHYLRDLTRNGKQRRSRRR